MATYRRLLDATVLAPGDKQKVSEAMDVGTSSRLEIQARILKAGTAGNLTLEHAAVNEDGAYTALTGASWACNATSNTPTTITIFPAVPSGYESDPPTGYEQLDTSVPADVTFVMEFRTGTVADYIYVVFVDPTASASVTVTVENPGAGLVWAVPSVPDSVTADAAPTPDDFPVDLAPDTWWRVSRVYPPTTFAFELPISADDDPIILLSSEPLEFTVA